MKKIFVLLIFLSFMVLLTSCGNINDDITQNSNDKSSGDSQINIYTFNIPDTGQSEFYSNDSKIDKPTETQDYFGQDASYLINQMSFTDNNDGTITDNVTGLMWQKDMDSKMTYKDAVNYANKSNLGGYDDWRIPTIKELFSLINFTGISGGETAIKLYIDTNYFTQPLGDTSIGEREIDAQTWSKTIYVSTTMNNDPTIFGVNFIDGRIKGYPMNNPRTKEDSKGYFRLVRGNPLYGINDFTNNGDGTITDNATGLMWQIKDDGKTRNWKDSLEYANNLTLAGYDDWRLPTAKELQSIVDYTRSPDTTNSPAIDEMFTLTKITDPNGDINYGYYWTSTSHLDGNNIYNSASYVSFGEALGKMNGKVMDVHGAGALRSDPKSGNENDYPDYFGPQGDLRMVYNFVLCVRNVE